MKNIIYRVLKLLNRNKYTKNGNKAIKNAVNLEWYNDQLNFGDHLSTVVYKYMLSERGLTESSVIDDRHTKHLMAIGSILGGSGDFDATVWGSGIRNFSSVKGLCIKRLYQKLDVRAVRGPFTRDALVQCGYKCPDVYGDPAIIMPRIYNPQIKNRKGTVLILHYLTDISAFDDLSNVTLLDIRTNDYKTFIDTIVSADRVISSSLHGIILAETYGVPAVFLSKGIESEVLKFYDWYYSTDRRDVKVAMTIEEAMAMTPMPLPELSEMRQKLIDAFPYDLWGI